MIVILSELLILLYLRRIIARSIITVSILIFHDVSVGIWIYAVFTLPGVLLHEIAHFFVAAMLGLQTGAIELLPTLHTDGSLDLGSVQVQKTDFARQLFVGIAPLLFSFPIIIWLTSFMTFRLSFSSVGLLYLIFTLSMHMFPSKRDLVSLPIVLFILFFGTIVAWIAGWHWQFDIHSLLIFNLWTQRVVYSLAISIGMSVGIYILSAVTVLVFKRTSDVQ